jgi:quinol monooxygenase YgiN
MEESQVNEFRVVMEVTTDDYEDLIELFREAAAAVREDIPGAVAWEVFGDETAGRALVFEEFQSEDAANAYEQLMESKGFIERAYGLFTSARVFILSAVDQPIWSEIAARPTSHCLLPVSGFRRPASDIRS